MTSDVTMVSVCELRTIQVKCKCGYGYFFPIEKKASPPSACTSCSAKFPQIPVGQLIAQIVELQAALSAKDQSVAVEFRIVREVK